MTPEQMRRAVLNILYENKRSRGRQGLGIDALQQQLEAKFGETINENDLQYNVQRLGSERLLELSNGDNRVEQVFMTIHGEAIARDDYTPPAPAVQNNYSINVSGGTVGPITQGVIHNLQMTINQLPDKDYESLKNSLQAMMDAVINSNELAEDAQADTLNYLQALAEQVSQPPEKRNLTIARVALTALPAAIGFSADLIGLWESDLAQPLLQALGLS
jgi:hypothetical protein